MYCKNTQTQMGLILSLHDSSCVIHLNVPVCMYMSKGIRRIVCLGRMVEVDAAGLCVWQWLTVPCPPSIAIWSSSLGGLRSRTRGETARLRLFTDVFVHSSFSVCTLYVAGIMCCKSLFVHSFINDIACMLNVAQEWDYEFLCCPHNHIQNYY